MTPAVCIVFKREHFAPMYKLMPRLASALGKAFESREKERELGEQKYKQNEIVSFTHVQDRRIRLLINAMAEMKKFESDPSAASDFLRYHSAVQLQAWTRNRSVQLGDELPSDAPMSHIIKEYLHYHQDCCAPKGSLGALPTTLADYERDRDGQTVPHPLAKLRWSDFTLRRVRDQNVYTKEMIQMHLPSLFTHEAYESLQHRRLYVTFCTLLIWVPVHGMIYAHLGNSDAKITVTEWIFLALLQVGTVLACVISIAWSCSLLLAIEFVKDVIQDLRVRAFRWAQDHHQKLCQVDNWELHIQAPAVELANYILPALTAWGGGILSTVVCVWLFCFLSLPLASWCVPSKPVTMD